MDQPSQPDNSSPPQDDGIAADTTHSVTNGEGGGEEIANVAARDVQTTALKCDFDQVGGGQYESDSAEAHPLAEGDTSIGQSQLRSEEDSCPGVVPMTDQDKAVNESAGLDCGNEPRIDSDAPATYMGSGQEIDESLTKIPTMLEAPAESRECSDFVSPAIGVPDDVSENFGNGTPDVVLSSDFISPQEEEQERCPESRKPSLMGREPSCIRRSIDESPLEENSSTQLVAPDVSQLFGGSVPEPAEGISSLFDAPAAPGDRGHPTDVAGLFDSSGTGDVASLFGEPIKSGEPFQTRDSGSLFDARNGHTAAVADVFVTAQHDSTVTTSGDASALFGGAGEADTSALFGGAASGYEPARAADDAAALFANGTPTAPFDAASATDAPALFVGTAGVCADASALFADGSAPPASDVSSLFGGPAVDDAAALFGAPALATTVSFDTSGGVHPPAFSGPAAGSIPPPPTVGTTASAGDVASLFGGGGDGGHDPFAAPAWPLQADPFQAPPVSSAVRTTVAPAPAVTAFPAHPPAVAHAPPPPVQDVSDLFGPPSAGDAFGAFAASAPAAAPPAVWRRVPAND